MDKNIRSVKLFYALMCLAGFLIILLPVGIANIVFGYFLGDSPCVLCWGEREAMIFIGLIALMIVRYGFKPRYISMLLIVTAFGMWQSFRHFGIHAGDDLNQGFAMTVFDIHTYFWAEIIFWSTILLLGVIFLFAPKNFAGFKEELGDQKYRKFNKISKFMFIVVAFILASNAFQALVGTGIPPFYGQSNPVRFSLNPKFIIWSTKNLDEDYKNIDHFSFARAFFGRRDINEPDFAFKKAKNLNIAFDNNSLNSPFKDIDKNLSIAKKTELDYKYPINSITATNDGFFVSSNMIVDFLDPNFKKIDGFRLDPYWNTTIDPIVGITPIGDDRFELIGSNKAYLSFKRVKRADPRKQFPNFISGYDKYEGIGQGLNRNNIFTIRSKYNYIGSLASDDKYIYFATTPNNLDQKTFVISKVLIKDNVLSGEFTPSANLKDNKTLGNLYITGLVFNNGYLYGVSKNHNVIVKIDPKTEEVSEVLSFPSEIKNARGIYFKDNKINILSYQDGKNIVFSLV